MKNRYFAVLFIVAINVTLIMACCAVSKFAKNPEKNPFSTAIVDKVSRESKIPTNAVKMSAATDAIPPLLYSGDFEEPLPVPGEINTAGAEDSPFNSSDGNTLYFFFTPDVNVPIENQILDGVTGIYMSTKVAGVWSTPERIILQDTGKLAGDGCEFVLGDIMYFCTVREGYTGLHWFTAEYNNGEWQNWKNADFNPDFHVGELHITTDGTELFFASDKSGGKGNLDIWVSKMIDGTWQEPNNVAAVNTMDSEGWPAISPEGDELWFSRNKGIWRSKKVGGGWQEAELIVSPLAGEPSIDNAGNLYFVHHFYNNDKMIEADLYIAYKK